MRTAFWAAVTALILASRLAHIDVLWTDEDYHLAAAIQLLHGKMLYRDLWYDKPPLNAWILALIGGWHGLLLRLLGSALTLGSCWIGWRFARCLWGASAGYLAAGLLAFYQVFYFAHATIPLEPDTLMILPHLAAVYLAWRGRALGAGMAAGIAFLLNPKGAFVGLAALAFLPAGSLAAWFNAAGLITVGFLLPNAIALALLAAQGALGDYVDQVWRWGLLYAGNPPENTGSIPTWLRPLNWLGFHAALVIGTIAVFFSRRDSFRLKIALSLWAAISLAAAGAGARFQPHYMNQLLPPLTIAAAGGFAFLLWNAPPWRRNLAGIALAAAALLAIVRFAPAYVELATDNLAGRDHTWEDVFLDQDSRQAAAIIGEATQSRDSIFIWGYRPNIVAYTRLPVTGKFWDSQPVTGVPADRHLGESTPLDAEWADRNRRELIRTRPSIVVDALTAFNPDLALRSNPELNTWLLTYCEIGKTEGGTVIYQRCR